MKNKLIKLSVLVVLITFNVQAQTELDGYRKGGVYTSISQYSPFKKFQLSNGDVGIIQSPITSFSLGYQRNLYSKNKWAIDGILAYELGTSKLSYTFNKNLNKEGQFREVSYANIFTQFNFSYKFIQKKKWDLAVVTGLRLNLDNWEIGSSASRNEYELATESFSGLGWQYYLGLNYQYRLNWAKLQFGYGVYYKRGGNPMYTELEIKNVNTDKTLSNKAFKTKAMHSFNLTVIPKWGAKKKAKQKRKLEEKLKFFK